MSKDGKLMAELICFAHGAELKTYSEREAHVTAIVHPLISEITVSIDIGKDLDLQ